MNVLKLRPHHINCLFFYEGKGYSSAFVENMSQIMKGLKENPKQLICLEKAKDSLCGACPHMQQDQCVSNEKVEALDEATLTVYGLKEQVLYPFEEIVEKIYKNYSFTKMSQICRDCEWYKTGVCIEDKIQQQQEKWLKG